MNSIALTVGGYAAAALLFWLWLGARDDLASAVEQCNTDKQAAIAEAERVARETEREAASERERRLRQMIEQAEIARERAQQAARDAEARPARVREVIREVATSEACIDTAVPDAVIRSLRD